MAKKVKLFKGDKPRVYLIDVTNRDGVQTARNIETYCFTDAKFHHFDMVAHLFNNS